MDLPADETPSIPQKGEDDDFPDWGVSAEKVGWLFLFLSDIIWGMADDFKPNIYPIMYWGLLYGLVAGFILILINFLSQYITIVWFPVFLAGVIWGGYRNYKKQKRETGHPHGTGSAIEALKEAATDIMYATRDMIQDQRAENVGYEPQEEEYIEGEEVVASPVEPREAAVTGEPEVMRPRAEGERTPGVPVQPEVNEGENLATDENPMRRPPEPPPV